MRRIVATGIVLLSLYSVAEAHRLSGTVTYYGGSDRLCGRRTASGAVLNCGAMTAAHRTLPFGTVLRQKGSRSIQVTVNDRGPFTGAFLDLSPVAASALGCRCTHRNVTATVVQMGSGGAAVASRGSQRPVVAVAAPPLFQPTEGVWGRRNVRIHDGHGSCTAPHRRRRVRHSNRPITGSRRDARNRPHQMGRAPNRLLLATFWNIGRGLRRQQFLDRLRKESLGR